MNNSRIWIVVASCLCAIAFLYAGISVFSGKGSYGAFRLNPTLVSRLGTDAQGFVRLPLNGPMPKSSTFLEKNGQTEAVRKNTFPSVCSPQKLMPQGADQDSGGLFFEEKPETSLNDYTGLIDFALVQALKRQHLPVQNIEVEESREQVDGQGRFFTYKRLRIYAGVDLPAFLQVLKDCLIAWAGKAVLEPGEAAPESEGAEWRISVNGMTTHTILFLPGTPDEQPPSRKSPRWEERSPGGPRIALVIDDMGESPARLQQLLALEIPLTIAVWPYAGKMEAVANLAYRNGLQVILHQPMEPLGYPKVNPGKGVLLRGMALDDMRRIVESNLRRVPHVSGLNNHMGSALTQDETAMFAVAELLKKNNCIVLDSVTHARSRFSNAALRAGAVTYRRNVFLDDDPTVASIMRQLRQAEHVALANGQAVVIGHPYDSTLSVLRQWVKSRDMRISLVLLRDATPLQR